MVKGYYTATQLKAIHRLTHNMIMDVDDADHDLALLNESTPIFRDDLDFGDCIKAFRGDMSVVVRPGSVKPWVEKQGGIAQVMPRLDQTILDICSNRHDDPTGMQGAERVLAVLKGEVKAHGRFEEMFLAIYQDLAASDPQMAQAFIDQGALDLAYRKALLTPLAPSAYLPPPAGIQQGTARRA